VLPTFHQLKDLPDNIEPQQDEESIARIADTAGWQVMKEYIESLISHLQSLEGVINDNSSVEQVGFKFLASNVACFYLQAVIDKVEGIKKFFNEEAKKKEEEKEKK
jgi:hypothetical protein